MIQSLEALSLLRALRADYEEDELVTLLLEPNDASGCWDDPDEYVLGKDVTDKAKSHGRECECGLCIFNGPE